MSLHAEIKMDAEFLNYEVAGGSKGHLTSRLLVQISKTGLVEDHYRVAIGGDEPVRCTFTGAQLTKWRQLRDFTFVMEVVPRDVVFKPNSLTAKWEDIETLLANNRLRVSINKTEDAGTHFRSALEGLRKAGEDADISLRWAVQAHAAYGFKLVLQALPASKNQLKADARLSSDDTSTIWLGTWTLASPLYQGVCLTGPEALLFRSDPGALQKAIKADPSPFLKGKKYIPIFGSKIKYYRDGARCQF